MKVGDYVRFNDRSWTEIGQITGEVEDSHLKVVKCRDGYYELDNFIKSSPNITDLIEVGDIIRGKDNHLFEVYAVGSDCVYINNLEEFILANEIKSILTKEVFSSVEYRVENN